MAIVPTPPPIASRSAGERVARNGAARAEPAPPAGDITPGWGNSAPLALLAFGVPTFMLSMINADAISKGVEPVVFGVALMCGGITALIAGIIQFRTGKTCWGVLFGGFGAFWLSPFAIAQRFLKSVPLAQLGHALGLFLYAFGIFLAVLFAASFRTNLVVVVTLALIGIASPARRAQLRSSHDPDPRGGCRGLAASACVFYMALAELCKVSYGRAVLAVWPLAKR